MLFKILLFCFFSIYLSANHIDRGFLQNDIDVIRSFDIDESYIYNKSFIEVYNDMMLYNKNKYQESLNTAMPFLPKIKKLLYENNIPQTFLYLAMAESYFNTGAKSRKRAKGVWQFMKSTARRYDLVINQQFDDRMDIVKSTKAAILYLGYQKKIFGSWYLAVLGYNCGEGRVYEAMARAILDRYVEKNGSSRTTKHYAKTIRKYQQKRVGFSTLYKTYKKIKKLGPLPPLEYLLRVQKDQKRQYFPQESRRYLKKILSLAIMSQKSFLIDKNNTHLLNIGANDSIKKFELTGDLNLENIASLANLSTQKLSTLNKHIRKKIIVSAKKGYNLYIPYENITQKLLDRLKVIR